MKSQGAEQERGADAAAEWRAYVDPAITAVIQAAWAVASGPWPDTRTGLMHPVGTGGSARAFVDAAPSHVDRWMLLDSSADRLDSARDALQTLTSTRGLFWQTRSVSALTLAEGVLAGACLLPTTQPGEGEAHAAHLVPMLAPGAPLLLVDLPCAGLLGDVFLDVQSAREVGGDRLDLQALRRDNEPVPLVLDGWEAGASVMEETAMPLEKELSAWWLTASVAAWMHRLGDVERIAEVEERVRDAWQRYGTEHAHAAAFTLRATWFTRSEVSAP